MKTQNLMNLYEKKIPSSSDPAAYHQHKICVDTVKNPSKALLGGPSVSSAKKTLKDKFGYTDAEITALEK